LQNFRTCIAQTHLGTSPFQEVSVVVYV